MGPSAAESPAPGGNPEASARGDTPGPGAAPAGWRRHSAAPGPTRLQRIGRPRLVPLRTRSGTLTAGARNTQHRAARLTFHASRITASRLTLP